MYKLSLVYCFLFEILAPPVRVENANDYERITIETVVILDEGYIANIRSNGHSTNESLYELMVLKWIGVQAEWGRADVFGYDVRIAIKEIVLWETNPTWYNPSTELDKTLYHICSKAQNRGLWTEFDLIYLFTGNTNTDGISGRAYTGKICVNGWKCAVSAITNVVEYVITAHEIGHSMGMAHDGDVGCPSPNDGIMGSKSIGWSSCSVGAMRALARSSGAACIFRTDVEGDNKINLTEAWPGMEYTNDEICVFKHGSGFRYKPNNQNKCSSYTCVNMNQTSRGYGVSFSHLTPTDGSNCGKQMVCSTNSSNQCISWADTGLNQSLFSEVAGNWSPWGPMMSCSRTCGTGVRYRQRLCNNPKPKNSGWCEGNEYDVELCNTEACDDDSPDEDELIVQRANETCTSWKENDVYEFKDEDSANYLSRGSQYSKNGNGQCEVKCDTIDNYKPDGNGRHGIIPDGTPCNPTQLSSFIEVNKLPRRSGMFGSCVQGYCYLFGCDNKTGSTQHDGCGLCGGDNSTCQIVEGIYEKVLERGQRETILKLPVNASLIQFYFVYSNMDRHFLELRRADTNKGIITYRTKDTTKDPVQFAGTEWYLLWHKQYLYAQGPTDEEVLIKLYNYGQSNNTGVMFAYSLPLNKTASTTTGSTEVQPDYTMSTITTVFSNTSTVTHFSSSSESTTGDSSTTHANISSPIGTDTSQGPTMTHPSINTTLETTDGRTDKRNVVGIVVPAVVGVIAVLVVALVMIKIYTRRRSPRGHNLVAN